MFLEDDNTLCVIAHVVPLVDRGVLQTSEHLDAYLARETAKALGTLRKNDSN